MELHCASDSPDKVQVKNLYGLDVEELVQNSNEHHCYSRYWNGDGKFELYLDLHIANPLTIFTRAIAIINYYNRVLLLHATSRTRQQYLMEELCIIGNPDFIQARCE